MENMNILEWLSKVLVDHRVTSRHLALYLTLMLFWKKSGFKQSFRVTRAQVLPHSKLTSTTTYHRILKDLLNFGYISYKPSFHPSIGSLIELHKIADHPYPAAEIAEQTVF